MRTLSIGVLIQFDDRNVTGPIWSGDAEDGDMKDSRLAEGECIFVLAVGAGGENIKVLGTSSGVLGWVAVRPWHKC